MSDIRFTVVLFIYMVSCVFSLPSQAIEGVPIWSESQVAMPSPGEFIPTPAFAFDHYGTPSICWSSVAGAGSDTVWYSQLSGLGIWSHRSVATGSNIGLSTAIAFDRSERPALAWMRGNGSVQCEFNNSGTVETICVPPQSPEMPALSLSYDIAGDLRGMLSYGDPEAGIFLEISHDPSSTFASDSLTRLSGIESVNGAVMRVDHQGLRHLATRVTLDAGGEAVVMASEPSYPIPSPPAWPSFQFEEADHIFGIDLAVSPVDGHMAMAYTTYDDAFDTSTLWFAEFNGVSMDREALLTSEGVCSYEDVSLAFDPSDGRPAMAFEEREGSNERLVFAYRDASEIWQTSLVDDSIGMDVPGEMLRGPTLAFDDYGTSWPAISYINDDGALMVAFDPPVPEPCTAGLLAVGALALVNRRNKQLFASTRFGT